MADTPEKTLMMQVIENLNNRIIPLELPPTGFLTSEICSGVIQAMNNNQTAPLYHSVQFYHIDDFEGKYTEADIFYYPFDIPQFREFNQLSYDFVFTLENSSLGFYDNYPLSTKLKKIEDKNRVHRMLHSLGYEPYSVKNSLGLYETFATKKDNPINPINIKQSNIDEYPDKVNLHKYFGLPYPENDPYFMSWGFVTSSHKNYDDVLYAPLQINMFRALQRQGLIIKPSEGEEPLPYHNKTLYYANPNYGYYDNYYDVFDFSGGGYDSNGNSLINGTAYACGFKVVWFTDTEFWITLKYKLVYTDKRPIQQYDPTLCCLAQCFGITN